MLTGIQEIFVESESVETGEELFVGIFEDVREGSLIF